MIVTECIHEFLADHRARGSRPATIRWYGETVTRLLRPHLESTVSAITVLDINHALGLDVAPASRANYDRALRGFFSWLHGAGLVDSNLFAGRKNPRVRVTLRETLSLDEVRRLFEVARLDPRFTDRNRAILAVFLGTGLRAGEVARLRMCDVDFEVGELRVDGKNGNAVVWVDRFTLNALRRYTRRARHTIANEQHLFLFNNRPVTAASLSRLVSRLATRAAIGRPVGAHLLRHTFATTYIRNGGDGFSLQRILRHSSPAMTQKYLHFASSDVREKMERYSPLAGM